MADRRSEWPMQPIGELLDRVRRPVDVHEAVTYREIGIRSHCKGIFHKPGVVGRALGRKRVFWIEPNCLVLNIVFAWEQAVALTSAKERGMIASHRFPMYRSINNKLSVGYAYLYFSSPRGKYALTLASPGGAGRNKTLGQEEFRRLRLSVPPREHQDVAVQVMSTWDKAIAQTEKLIDTKRKLKRGLMQQLLTGKRMSSGFRGADLSDATENGWQAADLGSIAKVIVSNVDKKIRQDERRVKLCNYVHVYSNTYISSKLQFAPGTATDHEIEKFQLRADDVIVTKDSETPNDIANPAHVTEDLPGVVCGYHLAILRPRQRVLGSFLAQLLRLPSVRNRFARVANGATRYGLRISAMERVALSVPGIEEQHSIARLLTEADREVESLLRNAACLREQRHGLMQQLLTGSVRVQV